MSLTTRLFQNASRTRRMVPAARSTTVLLLRTVPMTRAPTSQAVRSLSSFSPVQWWQDRQQTKEADKYKKRILEMSNKPDWTLQDMKGELDEVVNSWTSKVPGLNNNTETEIAKTLHQTITGLTSIVGTDATMDRLETMTRTEKLKAAAAASTTVQEINQLIQQFSTTDLMHKVLRHRQAAGRSLPDTPESTQAVIQAEGRNFLSAPQKQKMAKQNQRNMLRSMRKR